MKFERNKLSNLSDYKHFTFQKMSLLCLTLFPSVKIKNYINYTRTIATDNW